MRNYILFCCGAILCFVGEASAADIINKDTRPHELQLSCDGATTYARLPANAVQADAVHEGCVVQIKKKGRKIKVAGGDVLIGKKGRLKNTPLARATTPTPM
jgi:hypothetical protein